MSEEEDRLDGAALARLVVAAEKICIGHAGPHPFTTTPEDRQALRAAVDEVERRFFMAPCSHREDSHVDPDAEVAR